MKIKTVLAVVCAFLLLSAGFSNANELSELKKEAGKLWQKIMGSSDAETAPKLAQSDEKKDSGVFGGEESEDAGVFGGSEESEGAGVFGGEDTGAPADLQKIGESAETLTLDEIGASASPPPSASGGSGGGSGISFGGHLKLYIADRSDGKRNDIDQNNNLSAGFHDAYLYVSKSLSDWLMLSVQTKTSAFAGATPKLGSDISRSTSGSISTKISEATLTALLPYDVEMKVGVFDPLFSEEYGKQLWWHEQYHGNVGLLNLQEWHDVGVELYKNFDFGFLSLPAYLYLLNGDDTSTYMSDTYSYVDNNGGMSGMIHIAPEFYVDFVNRLKFTGSFGYGKWDEEDENDAIRYAAGIELQIGKLTLMSEYLYRKWEDVPLTDGGTADGERKGYYVKVLYNHSQRWRGVLKYSHAELYKASASEMLTDTYDTVSFGINFFVTDSSTIMPQVTFVDADRSDGSEELEYTRFTLGWRTTF